MNTYLKVFGAIVAGGVFGWLAVCWYYGIDFFTLQPPQ